MMVENLYFEDMKKLSNIGKGVVRNSMIFGEWLESIGKTYGDVYDILNRNGATEFNNIINKDGLVKIADKEGYANARSYQASDNGKRKESETEIDCLVGNIQEALFCVDNMDFKPNDKSTNSSKDITTNEDLIHIPSGFPVEFKFNYSKKLYGNRIGSRSAYYNHRNGKFAEAMEKGKIIIVYFAYLGKLAILSKEYFGENKSIRMNKEHWLDTDINKYKDTVTIWEGILLDYNMLKGGNSRISQKISDILKRRGSI